MAESTAGFAPRARSSHTSHGPAALPSHRSFAGPVLADRTLTIELLMAMLARFGSPIRTAEVEASPPGKPRQGECPEPGSDALTTSVKTLRAALSTYATAVIAAHARINLACRASAIGDMLERIADIQSDLRRGKCRPGHVRRLLDDLSDAPPDPASDARADTLGKFELQRELPDLLALAFEAETAEQARQALHQALDPMATGRRPRVEHIGAALSALDRLELWFVQAAGQSAEPTGASALAVPASRTALVHAAADFLETATGVRPPATYRADTEAGASTPSTEAIRMVFIALADVMKASAVLGSPATAIVPSTGTIREALAARPTART